MAKPSYTRGRCLSSRLPTLLLVRSKRARPFLDDKIVAGWNGMGIGAFALASRALQGRGPVAKEFPVEVSIWDARTRASRSCVPKREAPHGARPSILENKGCRGPRASGLKASPGCTAQGVDPSIYLMTALHIADFVFNDLWDAKHKVLRRSYRQGPSAVHAFAEDYAYLVAGLLDLFEASGDRKWLHFAEELQAGHEAP